MNAVTLRKNLFALAATLATPAAYTQELLEPIVLSSKPSNKTLDILMIAKPSTSNPFKYLTTTTNPKPVETWVYDICERKSLKQTACPALKGNATLYGDFRLQLNPGDTLKIHLVNQLPLIPDPDAEGQPGPADNPNDIYDPTEAYTTQNPTNLHTHGMLVSPYIPQSTDKTSLWGDSIYVLTFNSQNCVMSSPTQTAAACIQNAVTGSHVHGAIDLDATDYQIQIPKHHPSGLFWFHPHAHGISMNQIAAGLSGIITVGKITDYLPGLPSDVNTRHLILKDIQINGDNTLKTQLDPGLCDNAAPTANACTGSDDVTTNGSWNFTVNGQIQPTITVKPQGEIWRLTDASATATYDLQLTDTATQSPIVMQLLSIDGVTAMPAQTLSTGTLNQMGASKYTAVPCPNVNTDLPDSICISKLHLMPGARAEVWVANRNANQQTEKPAAAAVFETTGYNTGPNGDTWPPMKLANVNFLGSQLTPSHLNINASAIGDTAVAYNKIASELSKASSAFPASKVTDAYQGACQPLPAGYKRRIFFGYPTGPTFGLGMELIDQNGLPVAGSFQDITQFPQPTSICLPLGPGNTPVTEQWELVNTTAEDHNFHIHQTKFRVLSDGELTEGLSNLSDLSILQDSVPVLTGGANCDGTVATWRSGGCPTPSITVEIPFAIAGDFVYHCHILEHEDGGMMSNIHVVANPNQ